MLAGVAKLVMNNEVSANSKVRIEMSTVKPKDNAKKSRTKRNMVVKKLWE